VTSDELTNSASFRLPEPLTRFPYSVVWNCGSVFCPTKTRHAHTANVGPGSKCSYRWCKQDQILKSKTNITRPRPRPPAFDECVRLHGNWTWNEPITAVHIHYTCIGRQECVILLSCVILTILLSADPGLCSLFSLLLQHFCHNGDVSKTEFLRPRPK